MSCAAGPQRNDRAAMVYLMLVPLDWLGADRRRLAYTLTIRDYMPEYPQTGW